MKALRILEEDLLNANSIGQERYIKEAIAELEALENRSCDNCKANNTCSIYKIIGLSVGVLVSCKKWESK